MIDQSNVLIGYGDILTRIDEISYYIINDIKDKSTTPILVIVLKGAAVFSTYLLQALYPLDIEVEYVRISSYEGTSSTGITTQVLGINRDISGRDVIIVEDIIETGLTIKKLKQYLLDDKKVNEIKICTLFKRSSYIEDFVDDNYVGFNLNDNDFIIGFGLDYNEIGRNYPHIYKLN